jgi:hypothetical protein
MPTKFIVCKWLCDYCPSILDGEPECFVHERDEHRTPPLSTKNDLDALLENVYAKIDDLHHLTAYRRMQFAGIYERVGKLLNTCGDASKSEHSTAHDVSKTECLKDISSETPAFDVFVGEAHAETDETRNREYFAVKPPPINASLPRQRIASTSSPTHFYCKLCAVSFVSTRLLRRHRRDVHERDERPHPCVYCDQRFKRFSTLQDHQRTHTNERPHTCTVCARAFVQRSAMRNHRAKIHGVQE